MTAPETSIAAIVLAAGLSSRMGQPKMVLPWGQTTVIGQVVQTLWQGGVDEVLVVTGGAQAAVEQALVDVPAQPGKRLSKVHNPHHANGEMLSSVQAGLTGLQQSYHGAFLLALGDQPQIQAETVRAVIDAYRGGQAALVVPS